MEVTYDEDADAAYIYLRDPSSRKGTVQSLPVADAAGMVVLDFDIDGRLFGVEVLDASKAPSARADCFRHAALSQRPFM